MRRLKQPPHQRNKPVHLFQLNIKKKDPVPAFGPEIFRGRGPKKIVLLTDGLFFLYFCVHDLCLCHL